jgi:hypothetical protein
LRITASLANELCQMIGQSASQQARTMPQLLSRYARPASTSQNELTEALQRAIRSIDRALYRQMFAPPRPTPTPSPAPNPASTAPKSPPI